MLEKAEETVRLLAQENDIRLFILEMAAWRVAEPSSGDQCSKWVVRNQDTSGTSPSGVQSRM